ncbi:MAG: rhomboid family intramembrane serine protease [Bdellovibrionales bacterium]|nr:rhomboid family intramembrane serine protease [Bdellovibrionales bacterium]
MRKIYSVGFPGISPFVKALVIANISAWFLLVLVIQQFFLDSPYVFQFLGLVPDIFLSGYLWQPFTYMFIHASGIFHILFNMVILWMFGSELERLWGSKFFMIYYLTCGVGAALIYCIVLMAVALFTEVPLTGVPVVGSSGAIFGLMVAYGLIFKDRILYVMMIFPMRARTFIYFLAGIEILSVLSSGLGGPVANLAHLGGLATGVLFLIFWKNWHTVSAWVKRKKPHRLHVVRSEDVEDRRRWH